MARRAVEILSARDMDLQTRVAERAYFKAEQRGFAPGHELEDWLAAERELALREPSAVTASAPPAAKKKAVARKSNGGVAVKRAAAVNKD